MIENELHVQDHLFFISINLAVIYSIQEIEEVDTDEHYQPKSPIGIIDILLKHEP